MAHRWLGGSSPAARERAEASVPQAQPRAGAAIEQPLLPWQATRCAPPEAAHAALAALAQSWRYQQVETARVSAPTHYAGTGRPTAPRPLQALAWQRHAQRRPEQERRALRKQQGAGVVSGPPSALSQVSAREVRQAYTAHAQAEGGFRFLQDPLVFVSSLCVKQPCRMQGLLLGMTCALRV
jgi:hypothetical protein